MILIKFAWEQRESQLEKFTEDSVLKIFPSLDKNIKFYPQSLPRNVEVEKPMKRFMLSNFPFGVM